MPNQPRRYEPRYAQADRVIARFGTPTEIARLLGCERSTVYRWNHPRARGGSDGLVPTRSMDRIRSIARVHGVMLSERDLAVALNPNYKGDEQ